VRLTSKPLSAGAVERHWGRDRVSLVECGARHGALIAWRRNRDARLAGQALPESPKEPEEPAPIESTFINPIAGLFGAPATDK